MSFKNQPTEEVLTHTPSTNKHPNANKSTNKSIPKKSIKITTHPKLIKTQKMYKHFSGSALFRYRLLLATLTHKSISINNIHTNEENTQGLKDYELLFLQMLDKITNGAFIEINETGTKIRYIPGTLIGTHSSAHHLTFDCCISRSIVYWLEPLCILLLFSRSTQTSLTFRGSTYNTLDISIDQIRSIFIPLVCKQFTHSPNAIKIDIRRRSLSFGGEIHVTINNIKHLSPVHLLECGMVQKVRGLCYTVCMAPTIANRVRQTSNDVLYHYLSDVWIFNDKTSRYELQNAIQKYRNVSDVICPGYGLTLTAESTNGILLSVHQISDENRTAEEFGEYVAKLLLTEIGSGGTVDTAFQGSVCLLMALCSEDVSRVRFGRMTMHTVHTLRLIKDMLGVVFRVKEDVETGTIFVSCMGCGYRNIWKQAT